MPVRLDALERGRDRLRPGGRAAGRAACCRRSAARPPDGGPRAPRSPLTRGPRCRAGTADGAAAPGDPTAAAGCAMRSETTLSPRNPVVRYSHACGSRIAFPRIACSRRASASCRAASRRPTLVVTRAWGARIWDAEGREYLDFGGGIACQNLGHGNAGGRAGDPRAGRPLPPPVLHGRRRTSRTSRSPRSSTSSGPAQAATKSILAQLGRRGDRERGQDRARRDRPRRRRRLRPRVPRPHEPDDGDDVEARLQAGLRAARDRRATARRRRTRTAASSTEDALHGARAALQAGRRPARGRVHRARAGAGRRRLHPDAAGVRRTRCSELCDEHGILYVDDEVQSGCGRTGTVWAIERYDVEPDLLVLGQDARRRAPARRRSPAAPS